MDESAHNCCSSHTPLTPLSSLLIIFYVLCQCEDLISFNTFHRFQLELIIWKTPWIDFSHWPSLVEKVCSPWASVLRSRLCVLTRQPFWVQDVFGWTHPDCWVNIHPMTAVTAETKTWDVLFRLRSCPVRYKTNLSHIFHLVFRLSIILQCFQRIDLFVFSPQVAPVEQCSYSIWAFVAQHVVPHTHTWVYHHLHTWSIWSCCPRYTVSGSEGGRNRKSESQKFPSPSTLWRLSQMIFSSVRNPWSVTKRYSWPYDTNTHTHTWLSLTNMYNLCVDLKSAAEELLTFHLGVTGEYFSK